MKFEDIRAEIEYRRNQIARQRKDIQTLARMQAKVDDLCAERDKLLGEQRIKYLGRIKSYGERKDVACEHAVAPITLRNGYPHVRGAGGSCTGKN